jgi:hypothetical protein
MGVVGALACGVPDPSPHPERPPKASTEPRTNAILPTTIRTGRSKTRGTFCVVFKAVLVLGPATEP